MIAAACSTPKVERGQDLPPKPLFQDKGARLTYGTATQEVLLLCMPVVEKRGGHKSRRVLDCTRPSCHEAGGAADGCLAVLTLAEWLCNPVCSADRAMFEDLWVLLAAMTK